MTPIMVRLPALKETERMLLLQQAPQVLQYHPYVELRERYEKRANRDFAASSADTFQDLYSRLRVGTKLSYGKEWTGEFALQFADDRSWNSALRHSTTNRDASVAWVQHALGDGQLTVGRQPIAIGSQRLLGPLEWVNVPRGFDGVRWKSKSVDLFVAKIGVALPRPTKVVLAGVTLNGSTSLIYKHDEPTAGDTDIYTLDHTRNFRLGPLANDIDVAFQTGNAAGKRLSAFALHAKSAYKASPVATVYAEGNMASGGSSATKTRTFDNLYPSNHPYYGIMDMQSWRNMGELALGVELRARKDLLAKFSWHRFGLYDAKDAWYSASGSANVRPGGTYVDATGSSGRDVGQEFDLEAIWTASKTVSVSGGIGVFKPGKYVRSVLDSSAKDQTWIYLQTQFKF